MSYKLNSLAGIIEDKNDEDLDGGAYGEGYDDCLNDVRKIIANRIEELEVEKEEIKKVIVDANKISNLVVDKNGDEHDEDLRCEYRCIALMLEGELTRINARIDELKQLNGDEVVKDEG